MIPSCMDDEYLDLVNEHDVVIDKKLRSKVHAEKLKNYRAVNCFLINSSGKIWVPKRALNKRLFPGCLDMSMAGHVESGESYDQAFKRELAEELNLDADKIDWNLIGHLNPHQDRVSAFMKVYEIRCDEPPAYNPTDFTEYSWMTPIELLQKIEAGIPAKTDLPHLVRRFFFDDH